MEGTRLMERWHILLKETTKHLQRARMTHDECPFALESKPPATGLRKPKSPKVPERVLGRKRALLGGLLGAVPFFHFITENSLPALLPAVTLAVHFSRHSFQHSPKHFWGFGLSQSCGRRLRFQPLHSNTCQCARKLCTHKLRGDVPQF